MHSGVCPWALGGRDTAWGSIPPVSANRHVTHKAHLLPLARFPLLSTRAGTLNSYLRFVARGSRKIDMDTILVEIRAAEGGADAKSLVLEQYKIYEKYAALERL